MLFFIANGFHHRYISLFHALPLSDQNPHVILYSDYIPAQWRQYFVRDPCMIENASWHYLSISFMRNDAISSLPWFIVVFCHNYMFPPHAWVWPLIMITGFIWITLLRNITIFYLLLHQLSKQNKIFASDLFALNRKFQILVYLIS